VYCVERDLGNSRVMKIHFELKSYTQNKYIIMPRLVHYSL
jgi:hypothetical protein